MSYSISLKKNGKSPLLIIWLVDKDARIINVSNQIKDRITSDNTYNSGIIKKRCQNLATEKETFYFIWGINEIWNMGYSLSLKKLMVNHPF